MSADFEGDVTQHPGGRAIDSFRLGKAVVSQVGEAEIPLVIVEFTYQGKMVNGVGLTPDLAAELGQALVSLAQNQGDLPS